jgi:hypothetical protein
MRDLRTTATIPVPEVNMRIIILCSFMSLALGMHGASAGELRQIELTDGSTIAGEVLSMERGIYTVRSAGLGTVRIEESKIRAIRSGSPSGSPVAASGSGTAAEVQSVGRKMLGDQEVMTLIQSLQNDAEFQKILEDPEIMKAVNAGDITALTDNPRFMKLLSNPTVQNIQKKVK